MDQVPVGSAPALDPQLGDRLRAEVRPAQGRIPTWIHSDPQVHELEMSRVFGRAWLFVAHESELARPGDYVLRETGAQSVIVNRDSEHRVHVHLNLCPHRGMRLVRSDSGHCRVFRCPYHGFSFKDTGALAGVPFQQQAYPDGLDKDRLHLVEARAEVYQGMVFACWDDAAPPLSEFLGDLRWWLDVLAGRAEMEVVGPPQRWTVPTGWKIPAENFATDAYHTATAHSFLTKVGLTDGFDFGREGFHVVPGAGHGLGVGIQDEGPWYPPELRDEIQGRLSPDQLALLDRVKNFHGNVFPNMSFLIPNVLEIAGRRVTSTTLRLWQPAGLGAIRVYSWCLVEKHAPDWWKEASQRAYVATFGTSGMLEQDDTELWEATSSNFAGLRHLHRDHVLDYTMGIRQEPMADAPGPGRVYQGKYNEAGARGFYDRWLAYVTGDGP
jgi:phenylpropionate dioxygenase-like ring-hydroxylating dioxygenase large terminal subunit